MTSRRLAILAVWVTTALVAIVVGIVVWAWSCEDPDPAIESACVQTRTLLVLLGGTATAVAGGVAIVRHGRPRPPRRPDAW